MKLELLQKPNWTVCDNDPACLADGLLSSPPWSIHTKACGWYRVPWVGVVLDFGEVVPVHSIRIHGSHVASSMLNDALIRQSAEQPWMECGSLASVAVMSCLENHDWDAQWLRLTIRQPAAQVLLYLVPAAGTLSVDEITWFIDVDEVLHRVPRGTVITDLDAYRKRLMQRRRTGRDWNSVVRAWNLVPMSVSEYIGIQGDLANVVKALNSTSLDASLPLDLTHEGLLRQHRAIRRKLGHDALEIIPCDPFDELLLDGWLPSFTPGPLTVSVPQDRHKWIGFLIRNNGAGAKDAPLDPRYSWKVCDWVDTFRGKPVAQPTMDLNVTDVSPGIPQLVMARIEPGSGLPTSVPATIKVGKQTFDLQITVTPPRPPMMLGLYDYLQVHDAVWCNPWTPEQHAGVAERLRGCGGFIPWSTAGVLTDAQAFSRWIGLYPPDKVPRYCIIMNRLLYQYSDAEVTALLQVFRGWCHAFDVRPEQICLQAEDEPRKPEQIEMHVRAARLARAVEPGWRLWSNPTHDSICTKEFWDSLDIVTIHAKRLHDHPALTMGKVLHAYSGWPDVLGEPIQTMIDFLRDARAAKCEAVHLWSVADLDSIAFRGGSSWKPWTSIVGSYSPWMIDEGGTIQDTRLWAAIQQER